MSNTEHCRICNKQMTEEENCGGDCVKCMAEAGDPDCIRRMRDPLDVFLDDIEFARTEANNIKLDEEEFADILDESIYFSCDDLNPQYAKYITLLVNRAEDLVKIARLQNESLDLLFDIIDTPEHLQEDKWCLKQELALKLTREVKQIVRDMK